jgi:hypothetical protein
MTKLSDVVVTGAGTFETVAIDHTYAGTIAAGKHYLVDMSGASADKTLTLPAGASKAEVKFTVTGNHNNGWRVVVDGYSTEKILWEGTQYDDAKIMYANAWAQFSWDVNDSQWIVADASSPMTGTFSGSLNVTGTLNTTGNLSTSSNLGVGTTSPSVLLHAKGSNPKQYIQMLNAGETGYIQFVNNAGTPAGHVKYDTNAGKMSLSARVASNENDVVLDNTGKLGIGTSSPNNNLHIYAGAGGVTGNITGNSMPLNQAAYWRAEGYRSGGSALRAAELGVIYYDQSGAGGSNEPCGYLYMQGGAAGTNNLWVDNAAQLRISTTFTHVGSTSGTVVGTQTSDERLKENIAPINYGLETVLQLQPVQFDQFGVHKLGFGAQTTKPIVPESVFDTKEDLDGTENTKLGMDYSQIIPVLTKAIQEQQAQIEVLKAEVAALKAP